MFFPQSTRFDYCSFIFELIFELIVQPNRPDADHAIFCIVLVLQHRTCRELMSNPQTLIYNFKPKEPVLGIRYASQIPADWVTSASD